MITSVVTRSPLCPPTSSWPQTPGCHIPGLILGVACDVGGLRGGLWGGCHPRAEAWPLWAQPLPQTPPMGNITDPAKKHPESVQAWAPSATSISSDDHGLHFLGTDPDPTGGQAGKSTPLPGREQCLSPCASGDRKQEPKAWALWSAFCNYTGKFFSMSQR